MTDIRQTRQLEAKMRPVDLQSTQQSSVDGFQPVPADFRYYSITRENKLPLMISGSVGVPLVRASSEKCPCPCQPPGILGSSAWNHYEHRYPTWQKRMVTESGSIRQVAKRTEFGQVVTSLRYFWPGGVVRVHLSSLILLQSAEGSNPQQIRSTGQPAHWPGPG